jgi:hypothetical protein
MLVTLYQLIDVRARTRTPLMGESVTSVTHSRGYRRAPIRRVIENGCSPGGISIIEAAPPATGGSLVFF